MDEWEVSDAAKDKVRALAQGAAKDDNWMRPLYEEKAKGVTLSDFAQANQEAWMETCHFEHYYDRPISNIADEEEMRITGESVARHGEKWLQCLYLDLREAFWDEWDEAVGLYAGWKKAQEKTMKDRALCTGCACDHPRGTVSHRRKCICKDESIGKPVNCDHYEAREEE